MELTKEQERWAPLARRILDRIQDPDDHANPYNLIIEGLWECAAKARSEHEDSDDERESWAPLAERITDGIMDIPWPGFTITRTRIYNQVLGGLLECAQKVKAEHEVSDEVTKAMGQIADGHVAKDISPLVAGVLTKNHDDLWLCVQRIMPWVKPGLRGGLVQAAQEKDLKKLCEICGVKS